jgi:adhesin transport system membrane fusion protein
VKIKKSLITRLNKNTATPEIQEAEIIEIKENPQVVEDTQKNKIDSSKKSRGFIGTIKAIASHTKQGFINLGKFLHFLGHFTWLCLKASWRVLKVLYVIARFVVNNFWRIIKTFSPIIWKWVQEKTLYLHDKIVHYAPIFWQHLKTKLPIYWGMLEKNLPHFLHFIEVKTQEYWKILIEKIKLGIEKIKEWIDFLKKNYPIYKEKADFYAALAWAKFKEHRPHLGRYVKEYFEIKEHPEKFENLKDFVTDADHYILHQEPLRGMLIIRVALVSLFVLFIWSALTQVEELAKGDGKVVPSSQLQVLQSLDGGVVQAILVKEGDVVKAGQTLVQIDTTRFMSSVRENDVQVTALKARAERINALLENRDFVFPKDLPPEQKESYDQEKRYFENARIQLGSQVSAAADQLASANRELKLTKPLLATGAVSEVEVIRLEREVSRLRGLREQTESEFRNNWRKDLGDTMAKLNSLSEGLVGLEDRVKQSEIKSPMNGYVKRLLVNTVGGVVSPGKDIVEVVPSEDSLLLEARIQPKDIAFLRVGQKALIKLTAYDFSIYGGIEGNLDSIGADSITDEKGNTYYIVKVKTNRLQVKKDLPIIPGMQAEVDIQTGSKSILSYLLKPILRAKQIAFTER